MKILQTNGRNQTEVIDFMYRKCLKTKADCVGALRQVVLEDADEGACTIKKLKEQIDNGEFDEGVCLKIKAVTDKNSSTPNALIDMRTLEVIYNNESCLDFQGMRYKIISEKETKQY